MEIKPFKALRPRNDLCKSVASMPYDVLSLEEVKKEISSNPLSFLRVIRPEGDFETDIDPHDDKVYQRAKTNFDHLLAKGYLAADQKHCFYVYRQKAGDHKQIGFVGGVSVKDYETGAIKRHENTRTEKVNDRIRHIETINCQTGYIFLAYRSQEKLDKLLEGIEKTVPDIDFKTDDGVDHTVWIIREDRVQNEIALAFKQVKTLYICDGHHRAEAAFKTAKKRREKYEKADKERPESEYIMSIIYPHNALRILPYNRAVKNVAIRSAEDFITDIKKDFVVEKVAPNEGQKGYRPEGPFKIGMYISGQWYLLAVKDHIIKQKDPVGILDVSILQDHILAPLLGIADPKTDKKIEFIEGFREPSDLKDKVDSGIYAAAFSMHPTSVEQMIKIADVNKLMPPKSTWFDPKPRSGITIHVLS